MDLMSSDDETQVTILATAVSGIQLKYVYAVITKEMYCYFSDS